MSFTTFFATNVVNSPGIARGTTWGSSSLKTTLYTPLSLWTTLFEQIGVILGHFKSNWIFMKKYSVEYFLLFLAEIAQYQQKKLIFFKNHEFLFFSKNRNICPKCMKSKYDGPREMLSRFALQEYAYKPFGVGILEHMVTSWMGSQNIQNFDFKSRAHFRARMVTIGWRMSFPTFHQFIASQ